MEVFYLTPTDIIWPKDWKFCCFVVNFPNLDLHCLIQTSPNGQKFPITKANIWPQPVFINKIFTFQLLLLPKFLVLVCFHAQSAPFWFWALHGYSKIYYISLKKIYETVFKMSLLFSKLLGLNQEKDLDWHSQKFSHDVYFLKCLDSLHDHFLLLLLKLKVWLHLLEIFLLNNKNEHYWPIQSIRKRKDQINFFNKKPGIEWASKWDKVSGFLQNFVFNGFLELAFENSGFSI